MAKSKLSGYQIRLFAFLSVATFFEGYDFMALAQILPNLRVVVGEVEYGNPRIQQILEIRPAGGTG